MVDIAIGVPRADLGVSFKEHQVSYNAMIREISNLGYTSVNLQSFGCNCSENRNNLVEMAQEYKARYILFIDNDMYFFPGAFTKLFKADKDIISGINVYKSPPHTVAAYNWNEKTKHYESLTEWEHGETFEVDGVGGAFLLVKMEVFDKIEKPWFFLGEKEGTRIGNDFYFCNKAQEAGYKIWLDSSARTGHLGVYPFTIDNYFAIREANEEMLQLPEDAPEQ